MYTVLRELPEGVIGEEESHRKASLWKWPWRWVFWIPGQGALQWLAPLDSLVWAKLSRVLEPLLFNCDLLSLCVLLLYLVEEGGTHTCCSFLGSWPSLQSFSISSFLATSFYFTSFLLTLYGFNMSSSWSWLNPHFHHDKYIAFCSQYE